MENKEYAIGLDIGTSSLGWANTDLNGYVTRVKGQTGLGVRLFEEGQTAAERRGFRGTRRRLSRRRWRLRLLREIFDEPISEIDQNFFARQKASNISAKDSRFTAKYQLFDDQTDQEFYENYPTIYHLRWRLMTEQRKFDLREIYLAIHHIVKYRGNFLRSGSPAKFKPGNLDFGQRFASINESWRTILREAAPQLPEENLTAISDLILDADRSRLDRQRALIKLLMVATGSNKAWKPYFTEFAKAILGLKTKLFLVAGTQVDKADEKTWTFSLADIEDHRADLEATFSDTALELIEKLVDLQMAIQLTEIIPSGKYFSQSMIERYGKHAKHLSWLRDYIKQHDGEKKATAVQAAYDHYIDGHDGKVETQADFYKELKRILKDDDSDLANKINQEIKLEHFMPKQRTKENGTIPYQIQQQELDMIIDNQKAYYPFLGEANPVVNHRNTQPYKLDELVSFRINYYIGPLVTQKVQAKAGNAEGQFAWMVRKQANDTSAITPWNFDDKVDRTASANNFIQRMKTTDTYLIGEDVLPQQSLIYQRFMVLNELNNVRINGELLSRNQKQRIYNQVFKKHRTVSVKVLQENLVNHGDVLVTPKIEGLADPKHFNSALTTYHDFKQLLPDYIDQPERRADIETIINWSTIFEDAGIFKEKLQEITWLTDQQRQRISQKRYRGWGRLSARLLTGIKDVQGLSILDQLWQKQWNFMQIIKQPDYAAAIDKANAAGMAEQNVFDIINELYTSPQNKKALRQILLVVRDLQKAHHGQAPSRIFIEAARGAESNPRRTQQRQRKLTDLYATQAKKAVDEIVQTELKDKIEDDVQFTDRLLLYFMQNGRDIYTGKRLNIDNLSLYDVDHILPQALVKDDSLDNRALVPKDENFDKGDQFASILFGDKMRGMWEVWHKAGLISERKLKHLLMRPDELSKYGTAMGFINRQLVETRQVIKLVTDILSNEYDPQKTKIISVKASLTYQLRQELKLPKIRELNDYHHAFDAFLAARIGTYLLKRYPKLERFFVYGQYKKDSKLDLRSFNFIHDLIPSKKDEEGKKDKIINPKTDEVCWDRQADIEYIEHLLGLKHLLVTHELLKNHGALFNQTIYKAIVDKNSLKKAKTKRDLIPAKQDRPTTIYGGYSGQTTAYLAIVRINGERPVYKVAGIRTRMIEQLKQLQRRDGLTVAEATKRLLIPQFTNTKGKVKDFDIILPKVYLRQRIKDVVNGKTHQFGLSTNTYYRNFQQLILPLEMQSDLELPKKKLTKESLINIFDEICIQVEKYFSLYSKLNKFTTILINSREKFISLPIQDIRDSKGKVTQPGMKSTLLDIMVGLHGNGTAKPLKQLGFKTPLGVLQAPSGIALTDQAQIIYESPTGLFNRSIKLSEL